MRKKWKIVRSIKRQYIIDSDYLKKLPEAVQDFFRYVQSLGFVIFEFLFSYGNLPYQIPT